MITKKELLIFTVACMALILISLSGEKSNLQNSISFDTREDTLLVGKIKYRSAEQALNQKNRNQKNNKDLRFFRTKLISNNLDQTLRDAHESIAENADGKEENKVTAPKVAKGKKKDKEDKKKKVAKKGSNLKPIAPLSPDEDMKIAGKREEKLESTDLSSLSYQQVFEPTAKSRTKSPAKEKESEMEEDSLAENQQNTAETVSAFQANNLEANATRSIFTELLESDRLTEFEQLLNSDLSESQRIRSYQDSLDFLFSSNGDRFQTYEAFIYSQFFNDRHAVIITKSLNDPAMTFEQVGFSVGYLNQMVITWSSDMGKGAFKKIYEDKVLVILSQNEERRELFTGLQSSIEAKSLLLSDKSIEVSAN